MSTLTRKQREVHQRELMLLDVARKMLVENGYAGLNMDRLAEATEYSKGTIYQHFSTKEDLVTALALQTMERRTLLFAKAATFKGRPRERFMAIGVADELFGRLHPQYYRSEMIIKMADLEERASAERLATLQQLECSCLADVSAIVEDAVAQGDLTLPPSDEAGRDRLRRVHPGDRHADDTLHIFRPILENLAIDDPLASSRNNMQALLDGLGWRPLRAEWDYDSTLTRIAREVFPNEWQARRSRARPSLFFGPFLTKCRKSAIGLFVFLSVTGVTVAGRWLLASSAEARKIKPADAPPVSVRVVEVRDEVVASGVRYSAVVKELNKAELSFRVGGTVEFLHQVEGPGGTPQADPRRRHAQAAVRSSLASTRPTFAAIATQPPASSPRPGQSWQRRKPTPSWPKSSSVVPNSSSPAMPSASPTRTRPAPSCMRRPRRRPPRRVKSRPHRSSWRKPKRTSGTARSRSRSTREPSPPATSSGMSGSRPARRRFSLSTSPAS